MWAQTIRALDCNPWLVFQKPINPVYQDPFVPSNSAGPCQAGCDCSCCYGYPDASCHCYVDPCNCGDDRAARDYSTA